MSLGRDRLAHRLDEVPVSGIRRVVQALTDWQSTHDEEAIPFHLGMPDFDTPRHIKAALTSALDAGFVGYTASRGIPELRQAIANKLARDNDMEVDPTSEIVVTCGANEAISAAITATIDPGDEVIVPDPAWPHYVYCLRMAGAVPVYCKLSEADGFAMSPEAVAECWSERTRMVILNSPHNPTGAVMSRAQIEAIATMAKERGAWLLSDEPYEYILFDDQHVSPASLPGMHSTVLTVGCLSKTYAMTGWRLGWLCGPPEVVDAVNRVHLYTVTCAVSFVQKAAIAALVESQQCVTDMVAEYRRRRDLVVALLQEIPGVEIAAPAGAFYAFPNVSAFSLPSEELAMRLVQECGVGAVHGTAFGDAGEGYLRLAFTCSEQHIREGVSRMRALLGGLDH